MATTQHNAQLLGQQIRTSVERELLAAWAGQHSAGSPTSPRGTGFASGMGAAAVAGPGAARITVAGLVLDCQWERVEPLAAHWLGFGWEVSAPSPSQRSVQVQKWAESVAAEVRYLTEPLKLWEFDQVDQTAVVRSTPPARDAGQCEYFELIGQPERGELVRWRSLLGGGRERVPFALVHGVAYRLLADLVVALDS